MKKFLQYVISILALIVLFYVGIKLSSLYKERKLKRIEQNKCTANCFIQRIGNMKGNYAEMITYINGKKIIFKTSIPFPQLELGEVFTLEYNCNNIDDKEVLFYRPHFLVDDDFEMTKGKVTKTFPINCIEFSYNVKDIVYKRFQEVKSFDSIDFKKEYPVGYLKSNPYRAIIKFN